MRRYGLDATYGTACTTICLDVRATAQDKCLFIEAIVLRVRAGVRWRDLPAGPSSSNFALPQPLCDSVGDVV